MNEYVKYGIKPHPRFNMDKHKHEMLNTEDTIDHVWNDGSGTSRYELWACFDRDCDYHEMRFKEFIE